MELHTTYTHISVFTFGLQFVFMYVVHISVNVHISKWICIKHIKEKTKKKKSQRNRNC